MASVHPQDNPWGRTWRVRWREDGKQKSLNFETEQGADRYRANVDQYGPQEAQRILELEESRHDVPTVAEFLEAHVASLTGVQPATCDRYRKYAKNDIGPVFGDMPISAVTETTVGRWVQKLSEPVPVKVKQPDGTTATVMKVASAKTIQNKHGFLSGALAAAVKKDLLDSNPCEDRRLPEGQKTEHVYLTPGEFQMILDCIPKWGELAQFLVRTGLRFSEATALTPQDIDVTKRTVRVNKAWKYSTLRSGMKLGPPKTKMSNRTITITPEALHCLDLEGEWCFSNGVGNPIKSQEFYNQAWKPAREKAQKLGLAKAPRVHDLRHTHASWLVNANTALPVVQARLGHENITTTIAMYYHVDQRAEQQAAATVEHLLTAGPRELN